MPGLNVTNRKENLITRCLKQRSEINAKHVTHHPLILFTFKSKATASNATLRQSGHPRHSITINSLCLTGTIQLRVQRVTLPMITSDIRAMGAMNIRWRKSEENIWEKAYSNLISALNVIAVAMKIEQCAYAHRRI